MKEMMNVTAGDKLGINRRADNAKPDHAKAAGEAAGFGDEVKKFSEPQESGKPQALGNASKHKALGRNESDNKTHSRAENERLGAEESLANTYMNNALQAETNESQVNHDETAVTLNVQEFTPDVVDKAESFIAANSNAEQSPIPLFTPENVEAVKVVEAKKNAKVTKDAEDALETVSENAKKQADSEAFEAQAREILHKSVLWTSGELSLEGTAVYRPVINQKPVSEEPPLNAPSEPESKIHVLPAREMPQTIEKIAKILEIMALNGESFHDFIKENQGSAAAALLDKYDLWEKSQAGQEQNAVVNQTDSPNVNTTVNVTDSPVVNANTAEKQTAGYIPQAIDPAQLKMDGSKIEWTADDKIAVTVEQKTAGYSSDQGKIISQQTTAANLTPVDSDAMRSMYKQENANANISEKESASAPLNTSYLQQNVKPAVSESAQIPVSYTELANVPSALQQTNLTAETSVQPVQSGVQMFSQQADTVNVTSGSADGVANLALAETSADAESSDSQDTLQINTQANAAKAVDAAEKALSSLSRVDQQAIIEQITEKLQIAVRNGVHEMRITLRPQELGEVRMNIRVEGDQVTARMLVESEQVKAIVEKHFQQLKDALEQQNLHAAKLSVDVGTDADRQQMWREMAAMANLKRSKNGIDGEAEGREEGAFDFINAFGTDTGRRYGNNTFEYFV